MEQEKNLDIQEKMSYMQLNMSNLDDLKSANLSKISIDDTDGLGLSGNLDLSSYSGRSGMSRSGAGSRRGRGKPGSNRSSQVGSERAKKR